MKNVIVIGNGNIGMRHLQSLSSLEGVRLFGVEPNDAARAKAQTTLEGTPDKRCVSVEFFASLEDVCGICSEFDLAVIAVNSAIRRSVAEQLIGKCAVKNIIFEKVLFNKLSDYQPMCDLLKEKGINAWVNCVKRSYPYYRELKQRLGFGSSPISLSLEGNMWGIGCNTIHYVDFLAFLSDTKDAFVFDTSGLDSEILESKRAGYIEFTGTIKAASGKNTLSLTSNQGVFDGFRITIEDEHYRCEITENGGNGTNVITDKLTGTSSTEAFDVPFQSKLTSAVAAPILEEGKCALTTFDISAEYHKQMLGAFIKFVGKDSDICNIT